MTDFLGFAPSTIAAAAVLCAGNESSDDDDLSEARLRRGDTTSFHESINKVHYTIIYVHTYNKTTIKEFS